MTVLCSEKQSAISAERNVLQNDSRTKMSFRLNFLLYVIPLLAINMCGNAAGVGDTN